MFKLMYLSLDLNITSLHIGSFCHLVITGIFIENKADIYIIEMHWWQQDKKSWQKK